MTEDSRTANPTPPGADGPGPQETRVTQETREGAETPLAFSVVRGAPDAAELAALTVVLAAAAGSDDDGPASPRSRWAHPARRMSRAPGLGWAH